MLSRLLPLVLLAVPSLASPAVARDSCKPCNPQGAKGTNPPAVGQELKSLYVDVLGSVKDINWKKRWADDIIPRKDGFCCQENLNCVNVNNLNVPICYDKFTTQFAFPDGSYGSLTTGEYNAKDGSKANLVSGQYTKAGGESGDIYSQDPSARPNTATLSIPPQWTGSGVGSAIPATEIGGTITAAPSASAPATTPGTTPIATTTAGAGASASANAAGASSSSRGVAGHVSVDTTRSIGMSIISALMYVVYAL